MSKHRLVCPGCSLLCDGLTPDSHSNVPLEASDCTVATEWFSKRTASSNSAQPDVQKIQQLLKQARLPLITGIENLTLAAQQAAVRVADRYHTAIDTGWSNAGRGSMASFQRYGKVTATLGEVATRSDLVVFWFCDPESTHPRFFDRFIRNPDRPAKRVIVIDETETATALLADQFVQIPADQAVGFVQEQRLALADENGQSEFACSLSGSNYGCVVLGKPSGTDADFDVATDQWFQLVTSLNDHTRFVMTALRNDRNGISANNVLTSISGFPDAIRFTKSGPKWNGLEYSTEKLIARRECDMLLACDLGVSEPFESRVDSATAEWLRTVPVVVLSDLGANKYSAADVVINTGTPGWTVAGDFVRTDDIPIPMSAAAGVELPSALDVFTQLLD